MSNRKYPDDFINKIICGDSLSVMKEMPRNCVDMVITSPPYWGLRDYGTGPDQLGLEPTPELYIEHLTKIFNEAKRVLKKEGTLWLNIGDTYFTKTGASGAFKNRPNQADKYVMGNRKFEGLIEKCLCMIPERLAWSLIQNGWILRNKIIWYKPNAMPASVTDRLSNRWEYLFMFSRSQQYFFDLDAVREAYTEPIDRWGGEWKRGYCKTKYPEGQIAIPERDRNMRPNPDGKNPGDVFEIATQPFSETHFAVFPEKLCEKPIKAGCSEGDVVLDPFCGAGTALYVAKEMKRRFIGIDIKQEYCDMCETRLAQGVL